MSSNTALPQPTLVAKLGAEAFGTFLLVLVGVGTALYAGITGVGVVGVFFGFAFALIAGLSTVGHISGGFFNPAVTFGAAIAGRLRWSEVLPYWVSQVVGGTAAAAVLFVTIPSALFGQDNQLAKSAKDVFSGVSNGFDIHSAIYVTDRSAFYNTYLSQGATKADIDNAITSGQLTLPTFPKFELFPVLLIEIIVTAIFVAVILAVTSKRINSKFAPIVIGLTLGALIVLTIPFSNASLNPARSLATAFFSNGWALEQVWAFWVAPLVGALIAGLFYRGFVTSEEEIAALTLVEEIEIVEVVPAKATADAAVAASKKAKKAKGVKDEAVTEVVSEKAAEVKEDTENTTEEVAEKEAEIKAEAKIDADTEATKDEDKPSDK